MSALEIIVRPLRKPWPESVQDSLVQALSCAPDVAFAHLAEAGVPGQGEMHPALFVWLQPGALRVVRRVLNQLSGVVARALPDGVAVDVIILNSAPELLEIVDAVGGLIVEIDPDERSRALDAAAAGPAEGDGSNLPRGPWWWPF